METSSCSLRNRLILKNIILATGNIEKKIKIISPEKACDIADKEAQKDIYQYKDWKSDFYSRGEENNYQMAIELKNGINISNLDWEDDWKKTTAVNS